MRGFDGFLEARIPCGEVSLFVRHNDASERPALLLLHGYPQSSAMWHGVVPHLADSYHVICPDLRGYGRSDKPPSVPDHATYSKRAMAQDMANLLSHFGHASAFVGAHDRGARVAHRMGLDHPDRVRALTLLDIAPTRDMYAETTDAFARAYWHWFFLILPAPMPERMIEADPRGFWLGKSARQFGDQMPFHPDALEEYLSLFENPETIRASCEDYRAAAGIDLIHDEADLDTKLIMPVQALWARQGVIERCFDPLDLWQKRATHVEGEALDGTHFFAEETPQVIAERMRQFFTRHA